MDNNLSEKYSFNYNRQNQVNVLGKMIEVPVKYSNLSAISAFFPISIDKANDLLGSSRLRPVGIFSKRCLLNITIFDFIDCPVGPYRELALSIPVVLDYKFSVPFVPLIFNSMFKKFGFFTILLAMNTEFGREHSKVIWDYPTYEKGIRLDIARKLNHIMIDSSDGEKDILSIEMQLPEKYKESREKYNTYFKNKDNKIFKVRMDTISVVGHSFKKDNFVLILGDSKISNLIKNLSIELVPLETFYYKRGVEVLHAPIEV